MSAFPSLAEVLAEHRWRTGYVEGRGIVSSCSRSCGWSQDVVNSHKTSVQLHDLHVADMWREACTINTVEQLDGLPLNSVVVDRAGIPRTKRAGSSYMPGGWTNAGLSPLTSRELADGNPMVVVWNPEWSTP